MNALSLYVYYKRMTIRSNISTNSVNTVYLVVRYRSVVETPLYSKTSPVVITIVVVETMKV